RGVRWPQSGAGGRKRKVRRDFDGCADAGDGLVRGHLRDPPAGTIGRPPHAHRGHDRARTEGRRGTLPAGRGMDAYLTKPIPAEQLYKIIESFAVTRTDEGCAHASAQVHPERLTLSLTARR